VKGSWSTVAKQNSGTCPKRRISAGFEGLQTHVSQAHGPGPLARMEVSMRQLPTLESQMARRCQSLVLMARPRIGLLAGKNHTEQITETAWRRLAPPPAAGWELSFFLEVGQMISLHLPPDETLRNARVLGLLHAAKPHTGEGVCRAIPENAWGEKNV
jgi:hypothetical protein